MKELKEVIQELSIDNLQKCQFEYSDKFDFDELELSDGIEEDFWMRMYYGGSVTSETHKKFKENGSIKYGNVRKIMKIYDYIFDMRDASTIEDNEANEIRQCLVDLYIMRPKENFSYEDKLKELMFYTYLHTKDNCLSGTFGEQTSETRDYFCKYLETCKADGVEVYLLEYTTNQKLIQKIKEYCKEQDFHFYISNSLELR